MEIKIDDLDIKILRIFNNLKKDEVTGTRIITQYLFPDLGKGASRSKEMFINYKIKKLKPFIKIEKGDDGFYEYTLIEDNVSFTRHKFSSGIKEALILKNEKEIIFEL